jgi:hypothetical protein
VLRSSPIWENNIKTDRKIRCEYVDWAELAKIVPNSRLYEHGNEPSSFIKVVNFFSIKTEQYKVNGFYLHLKLISVFFATLWSQNYAYLIS